MLTKFLTIGIMGLSTLNAAETNTTDHNTSRKVLLQKAIEQTIDSTGLALNSEFSFSRN